jgi:putative hydrolase of the HAD superfamily
MQCDAVLLDVGGVFFLPRHEPLLEVLGSFGVTDDRLDRAHYAGVAAIDRAGRVEWAHYRRGYLTEAGVPPSDIEAADAAFDSVWSMPELWARLLPGTVDAMKRLAATGVEIGIVSNSNGTVEAMLLAHEVCQVAGGEGSCTQVAVIVDSHVVGVEKPDPAIFGHAFERLSVEPERAIYVGDTVAADVVGARAVGMHPLHLDPYGFCPEPGDHDHVRSLDEVADLVLTLRS